MKLHLLFLLLEASQIFYRFLFFDIHYQLLNWINNSKSCNLWNCLPEWHSIWHTFGINSALYNKYCSRWKTLKFLMYLSTKIGINVDIIRKWHSSIRMSFYVAFINFATKNGTLYFNSTPFFILLNNLLLFLLLSWSTILSPFFVWGVFFNFKLSKKSYN